MQDVEFIFTSDEFYPVSLFEESNLVRTLDWWPVNQVCVRILLANDYNLLRLAILINISDSKINIQYRGRNNFTCYR